MPIILDRKAVDSLFPPSKALIAARQAFLALAGGDAVMPQRIATRVDAHQGTHLSMPCYVRTAEREVLSIKVATVFEGNRERGLPTTGAFMLLHDPETGELRALMDAELLTARRTAAASALACDLFARPDASTMVVFGTGGQAEAHVQAICDVRQITKVFAVARSRESAESLAPHIPRGAEFIPTTDREMAVRTSEIVVCATNSSNPLFAGATLSPSTFVAAIGAFRPDMRELDDEAIRRAWVVVDQLEAAQRGAGDLIQANRAGALDWADVRDLGSVLAGGAGFPAGRDCVVFKSVGLAVQDAVAAGEIYAEAVRQGIGSNFTL